MHEQFSPVAPGAPPAPPAASTMHSGASDDVSASRNARPGEAEHNLVRCLVLRLPLRCRVGPAPQSAPVDGSDAGAGVGTQQPTRPAAAPNAPNGSASTWFYNRSVRQVSAQSPTATPERRNPGLLQHRRAGELFLCGVTDSAVVECPQRPLRAAIRACTCRPERAAHEAAPGRDAASSRPRRESNPQSEQLKNFREFRSDEKRLPACDRRSQ